MPKRKLASSPQSKLSFTCRPKKAQGARIFGVKPLKGGALTRVLIADSDLDSHELMDDLIEINFRDALIDHALTKKSFLAKVEGSKEPFNLILFNLDLDSDGNGCILSQLREQRPELLDRMVFIGSEEDMMTSPQGTRPFLKKPFSLDRFGEVVSNALVN